MTRKNKKIKCPKCGHEMTISYNPRPNIDQLIDFMEGKDKYHHHGIL